MLNQQTETSGTAVALGFEFEPLGVVRLKAWHLRQGADGVTRYDRVEEIAVLTNADKVNPQTLARATAEDPAGVPVVDFLYAQLPTLKTLVEGYAVANQLI